MSVTIEISELDADLWDAFQRGGPWIAHSEYMQLKAENAKLRKELESVGTAAYLYGRSEIKAENAKLRKLTRMMWLACKSNGIVGGIYAYPDMNSNADEWIRFEPLLRELGIEVE